MANSRSYGPRSLDRNISRYIRSRQGIADEDIAREDGVKVETVRQSIRAVQAQRMLHTQEFANEAIVGILVDTSPQVKEALTNGLTATTEYTDSETQKKVTLPDVKVQLQAVEQYKNLASVVQKKETRVQSQVNVGLAVGARVGGGAPGGYIGVEDRIRKLRERMDESRQLPQESVVVAPPEEGEEQDFSVDSN